MGQGLGFGVFLKGFDGELTIQADVVVGEDHRPVAFGRSPQSDVKNSMGSLDIVLLKPEGRSISKRDIFRTRHASSAIDRRRVEVVDSNTTAG